MVKSGIIIGIVGFVLVLGSAVIFSPLCAPCWGLILGLAAGYLAGVFEKPTVNANVIKRGAIAGAIAGGLVLVGALIGGIINASLLNPSDLRQIYEWLGVSGYSLDQTTIWAGQLGSAICGGLLNVALMAGMGAAGGALWWQIQGKNKPVESSIQY